MAIGPIQNLQLRVGLATGSTATTSLAVTALDGSTLATTDVILGVLHFTTAASIASVSYVALTEVSIPAAGYIACATTDTSSDQLMVFWHDSGI